MACLHTHNCRAKRRQLSDRQRFFLRMARTLGLKAGALKKKRPWRYARTRVTMRRAFARRGFWQTYTYVDPRRDA